MCSEADRKREETVWTKRAVDEMKWENNVGKHASVRKKLGQYVWNNRE